MKMYKISILFLFNLLFIQLNYAQIKGWEKVKNDIIVTYYPNDLKKGQNFIVILYPPQKIKNKKDFFQKFAQKLEKRIAGTQSNWEIETGRDNELVTKKELFYKGAPRIFHLKTIELNNNKILIVQVVHDKDADYSKKYFNRISAVFDDIEKQYFRKPSKKNDTKVKESNPEHNKPNFNEFKSKIKYKHYLLYGYIDYGINGAEGVFEAALFFNDGTCSSDVNTIITKGIAFSKKKNPNLWGKYHLNGKKLRIKWLESDDFEEMDFYEKLDLKLSDFRLNNCWYDLSGNDSVISTGVSFDKWCFSKNGRFSNERAIAVSGGDYGGYSGHKDKQGWYQINGNILQLIFDNGTKKVFMIGLTNDRKQLSIGDWVFQKE